MAIDDDWEPTDDDAPDAPPRLSERRAKARKAVPRTGEWGDNVSYTKEGEIRGTPGNLALFLRNSKEWRGCLGYNSFRESEVWLKDAPDSPGLVSPKAGAELADEHDVYVHHWFDRNLKFSCSNVTAGITAAARANSFDPLQQYLEGLVWDGTERVPRLLSEYFGARETPYIKTVGTMWIISAIARAMRPGDKVDTMVILEGEQGSGKSSGLAALSPQEDWFSDTPIDLKRLVDAYQSLRGKWIYEIGELDSFKSQEATRIKNFLSNKSDNYRASYGKRNRDYPRHCVFAGTTNEDQYLTDRSGNRRFWPARCGVVRVDAIAKDRDQLWAEALVRFRRGEKWYADSDEEIRALIKRQQASRLVPDDPWKLLTARWLSNPTVPVDGSQTERSRVDLERGFTGEDVLLGAIGVRKEALTTGMASRIGAVLKSLDYFHHQRRVPGSDARERVYLPIPPGDDEP